MPSNSLKVTQPEGGQAGTQPDLVLEPALSLWSVVETHTSPTSRAPKRGTNCPAGWKGPAVSWGLPSVQVVEEVGSLPRHLQKARASRSVRKGGLGQGAPSPPPPTGPVPKDHTLALGVGHQIPCPRLPLRGARRGQALSPSSFLLWKAQVPRNDVLGADVLLRMNIPSPRGVSVYTSLSPLPGQGL